MISMSKIQSIRELRRRGESISDIARAVGVSRNTVYKYLDKDDFSPEMPIPKKGASILDEYKPLIEGYLEEDERNWRKQRHTARRIWERLRDEHGCTASESTVRHYVAELRRSRKGRESQYLTLSWAPGEAQVDFGEADFRLQGVRMRLLFLAVSFPYSNVAVLQVFRGQNAECVCQGLRDVFEFLGGVPTRLVFDNATGVGRKVADGVRTTELFGAFAVHYGFSFSFCNPDSGHEKSNVERKVGYLRANLMVPVPSISSIRAYNKRILGKCMELSAGKVHWSKGEPEDQLFIEDRFAMGGLPEKPFEVVRWETMRADKQGRFRLETVHIYSSAPELAGTSLLVGIGAHEVMVFNHLGAYVCTHERAYGEAPTDTENPASQIALLRRKANAWANSQVRASLPDELREHMDALSKHDLRAELATMARQVEVSGYDAAVDAMACCLAGSGRIDEAGVAIAAARAASGAVDYDGEADLSVYDMALGMKGGE